MSLRVVQARGLSKQYVIGSLQKRADTIRDVLIQKMNAFSVPFGKGIRTEKTEKIWALKDISFEVQSGGHNSIWIE